MTELQKGKPLTNLTWWDGVHAIAQMFVSGSLPGLDDATISQLLANDGLAEEQADMAIAWLQKAHASGYLTDSLSMLATKERKSSRVEHPMERLFMSKELWSVLQKARQQGLAGEDLIERVIASMRMIDTRDWDESDLQSFLVEALASGRPHEFGDYLEDLLRGQTPRYFS